MDIQDIAEVCHEANRALCEAFGDPSQVPWAEAPEWQRASAIAGVRYTLKHPRATPQDAHDVWCNQKLFDGWKYGPIKDESKKEHPCMVPYRDLPADQRAKDHVILSLVKSLRWFLDAPEITDLVKDKST